MRVWDLHPKLLCRKHLLGEHRELHAIYTILALDKKGYRSHPETKRWEGKLKALAVRHKALVVEMGKRGYNHASPLDMRYARGAGKQTAYVHTPQEQREILKAKGCECRV